MKSIIATDKKRSAEDILLDAVLNFKAGVTEPIPYEKLLEVVSDWYAVDLSCRKFGQEKEQKVAMYLMHEFCNFGYDEIAVIMEKKNHMTVIHSIDSIERDIRKNKKLRNEILEIAEKLKCDVFTN